MGKEFPVKPEVKDRKTRFEVLNEFVRSRNGWVTSVPGDVEVTIACLVGSTLPEELQARGYDLVATGDGERIYPAQSSRSWSPVPMERWSH
jgi:hypothetical protein